MTENSVSIEIPDRLLEGRLLVGEMAKNINVAVIPSTDEDIFR